MNLSKQETYPIAHYLTPLKLYKLTDVAYLAGYFDGEGCITSMGGTYGGFRISVQSGDLYALDLFAETFGGKVFEQSRSEGAMRPPKIRIFHWYLSGPKCLEPLRAMFPYLRAKHREAEAVLHSGISFCAPGVRLQDEEKQRRFAMCSTLRALKRGGRQQDFPI